MKPGAKVITDIYRFDVSKEAWTKRKDYELVFDFKFAGNEYCITKEKGWYYVCSCFDNEDNRLYCLYKQKDENTTPGEVVSEFRKRYVKNNINLEKITEFLLDPLKICPKP